MARNKSVALNYKNLTLSVLRDKSSLLFLGAGVVILLFMLIGYTLRGRITVNKPSVEKVTKETNKTEVKKVRTYLVKEGDYLWKIAEGAYGSGFNAYDIARANNISNPSLIEPGQSLILPEVKSLQPTKGEIAYAATAKVTYTGDKYTIKQGDNLWDIALQAYGDGYAWSKIANANHLEDPDIIHVGNTLILPR